MNLKLCITVISILITIGITSCVNDDLPLKAEQSKYREITFTKLGNKKEIPFTIENMQKAYENLLNNKTAKDFPKKGLLKDGFSVGNYTITTTHKYIKFLPQDSLQYETIINDSILSVSDIPFEYEYEDSGDIYIDPSLPPNSIFTYYYSVVPVDYPLPQNVPSELIANLHFTPEDLIQDNPTPLEKEELNFYHDLNLEAEKITDNLAENEKEELFYNFVLPDGSYQQLTWQEAIDQNKSLQDLIIDFGDNEPMNDLKSLFGRKWYPSGKVTTQEDALMRCPENSIVGVAGAEIKIRKWGFLVVGNCRTNATGDFYKHDGTRTKRVKYSIFFNYRHQQYGPRFSVKAGTVFWEARYHDTHTHTRTAWYKNFDRNHDKQFYALVQNAGFDYHERLCTQYGLSRPRRVKIVAKRWYDASSHATNELTSNFFVPDVVITIGKGGRYRGSDGIYATTIHELTHIGHNNMDPGMFSAFNSGSNSLDRKVMKESWAEGVEGIVTKDRYKSMCSIYAGIYTDTYKQYENASSMNAYTPIVVDLVDNLNQRSMSPTLPDDNVTGYTLNQIQTALNNTRSINAWEYKLINSFNNSTENGVPILFDYVRQARHNIE